MMSEKELDNTDKEIFVFVMEGNGIFGNGEKEKLCLGAGYWY